MKHPDKWRETIDPFLLPYKCFRPTEILGYPHAGNDVFHAKGIMNGKEVTAYIKVARQSSTSIENEVDILSKIEFSCIPTVIDFGFDKTPFSVTLEIPGERLSTILEANEHMESMSYLSEYGSVLANIHHLDINSNCVKDRRFFHVPSDELLDKLNLAYMKKFFSCLPANEVHCFCHGDFHYANVLWQHHHISGILDFELAGIGNRDFDIAWALFRRPGQQFLKSSEEQNEFLHGYEQFGEYNTDSVKFYMAQCYVYFLKFCEKDEEYSTYIRTWLQQL